MRPTLTLALTFVLTLAAATTSHTRAAGDDFYKYTSHNPDTPENAPDPAAFATPSGFAKPQTWWHWINGNVSREGIENDLREMADKGYGFARIFHIDGKINGPLTFNTPEWFDTFKFATETAAKYGLGIGIHNCDGWSEAGGPWITPELSMKELTLKTICVTGDANCAEQSIPLPALEHRLDYARDIAVLAWPAKRPMRLAMHQPGILHRAYSANEYTTVAGGKRELTLSGAALDIDKRDTPTNNLSLLFDGLTGEKRVAFSHDNTSRDQYCGVTLEFAKPFEAAGVFTEVYWMYELPLNIFLESSDDGIRFEKVCELKFRQSDATASFPPRKAKYWCLVRYLSQNPTERVHRGVVREHVLNISELELLAPGEISRAAAPIDNFKAKAGVDAPSGIVTPTTATYPEKYILKLSEVRDLTNRFSAKSGATEGTLRWNVPPGQWIIMRIGYTTTAKTNHPATKAGRGLEVDKFEPAAVARHFESYDAKMIDTAGPLAGKTFSIIETDSWEAGTQNWTQNFERYFRERNGYDILNWLPVYAGECIENVNTTEKFLADLRQTFSSLIMDNFYGRLGTLIRSRGLKYETEPAGGIFMRSPMNSYREADFPMTEIWQDPREPGIVSGVRTTAAREVASTAHFYGKKYITCEALTSRKGNWAETPWIMKGTLDTLLLAGTNVAVFHSYTHQPDERAPGWQMEPWGISQNRKLPWWSFSKDWFTYIARTQYMLQQGKYAAKILLLYSDEIPTYGATMAIQGNHLYDVIEGDGARNYLKVENGKLTSPGRMRYDLMVISPNTTLRLDTLEKLKILLETGATISAQKTPAENPSLRGGPAADARWRTLVTELFGDGSKAMRRIGKGTLHIGYTPDEMVKALNLREPFTCTLDNAADAKDIGWTHREHADGSEWFWLINRDSGAPRSGIMSFALTGKTASIWRPESGTIEPVAVSTEANDRAQIPLSLEKMEGVFVVFTETSNAPTPIATRVTVDGVQTFPAISSTAGNGSQRKPPRIFITPSKKFGVEFYTAGNVTLTKAGDGATVTLDAKKIPAPKTLTGPWAVTFDAKWGAPAEPQRFEKLASWTESAEPGIRHYSGTAIYTKAIELDTRELPTNQRAYLEIDQIYEVAEVTINGQRIGTLWRPPYRIDITGHLHTGKNTLRIAVANTWVNRCLYDATLPESERLTWANSMRTHFPDPKTIKPADYFPWKYGPLPSGLIGEAKVSFSQIAEEQ